MPIIKSYHHGGTAGVAPSVNNHKRAKRGDVGGWSAVSTRSNTRFLYSVREKELTGWGGAYTLTVKDCPVDHEDWKKLREAFFVKLRRMGMVRCHWVTEWQRRGVPHLHCAIWFESDVGAQPLLHWWNISKRYGSSLQGQHCRTIHDTVGWFQYLAKHAARGVHHYQRSAENIPDGWKKTGRMWGYVGQWPVDAPLSFHVDQEAFYAFRRMVRGLRKAEARLSGDIRQIKYSRRMLTCHNKDLSHVRGVSEWIDQDTMTHLVICLGAMGHEVEH